MKDITALFLLLTMFAYGTYAQSAYIEVRAKPNISVYLDGVYKGVTSVDINGLIIENVSAGEHIIRVEKEGFNPQQEKLTIETGEVLTYEVRPFVPKIKITQKGNGEDQAIKRSTGTLKIQSIPVVISLEIPLLGIKSNKKEDKWKAEKVPSGKFHIIYKWNDKTLSDTVEIRNGLETHLLINMIKLKVEDLSTGLNLWNQKSTTGKGRIINDLILLNLNGNIVELSNYIIKGKKSISKIIEDDRQVKSRLKTKMVFNPDGNIHKKYMYNLNGNLNKVIKYYYGQNGKKIKETMYSTEYGHEDSVYYTYDQNGNQIGTPSAILFMKTINYYNEMGRIRKKEEYKKNDIMFGSLTYSYDDRGNLKQMTRFKGNSENQMFKKIYKNDDYGNMIKTLIYDANNTLKFTKTYTYKYDEYNNWIQQVEFDDGKPETVIIREIDYY